MKILTPSPFARAAVALLLTSTSLSAAPLASIRAPSAADAMQLAQADCPPEESPEACAARAEKQEAPAEPQAEQPAEEAPAPAEPQPEQPAEQAPAPAEPQPEQPAEQAPAPAEPQPEQPAEQAPAPAEPQPEQPAEQAPATAEPQPEQPAEQAPAPAEPQADQPAEQAPAPAEPQAEQPAEQAPAPAEQPAEQAPAPAEPQPEQPAEQAPAPAEPQAEQPAEQAPAPAEPQAGQPAGEAPAAQPEAQQPPSDTPILQGDPNSGQAAQPEQRPRNRRQGDQPQTDTPVLQDGQGTEQPAQAPAVQPAPDAGQQPAEAPRPRRDQNAAPLPVPTDDRAAQEALRDVRPDSVTTERGRRIEGDRRFNPRERKPRSAEVVRELGDRFVLELGGNAYVESDERPRLRRNATEFYTEELPGDRVREVVVRRDGTRVVTIYNGNGDILRRSRIGTDDREYVLLYVDEGDIDDLDDWRDPGLDMPPLVLDIPREEYILDADNDRSDDDYYTFLEQPPVEAVERLYSVDEVKRSARVRQKTRRIDLDTITFEFGSDTIPEDQINRLEGVASAIQRLLKKNPAETLLIEGHTDAVGSDYANLALSDRRAEAVASALTNVFEIPPENLATQGYGEEFLKVRTDKPERENRRVAIRRITPLVAPVASAN